MAAANLCIGNSMIGNVQRVQSAVPPTMPLTNEMVSLLKRQFLVHFEHNFYY